VGRTSGDVELGRILGQFAGNYNSPKPDSYRSGVQMRLNENADSRQAQQLDSQLATQDLQRQKMQMDLDAARRQQTTTPNDILAAFGVPQSAIVDTEMADSVGVPADTVDPTTLATIRRITGGHAMNKAYGNDTKIMTGAQEDIGNMALRNDMLTGDRKPDDVGRIMAALSGRGYDENPGRSGGSGSRDAAMVNALKFLTSPKEQGGFGMDPETALATYNRDPQKLLSLMFGLQRANIAAYGAPEDLGNINAQIQNTLNPGQVPREPDISNIVNQFVQPQGNQPVQGMPRTGYQGPPSGTIVKSYR
jgi:hypothetical protein